MSERTAEDLGLAVERMMRALVKRAGNGEEGAILVLAHLDRFADYTLTEGVQAYRAFQPAKGEPYSWADIGRLLGITRQAAHERHGWNTTEFGGTL